MRQIPTSYFVMAGIAAAVTLGIGVIIGHFTRAMPEGPCLGGDVPDKIIRDIDSDLTRRMKEEISADQIKENLRSYTRIPHVGGLEGSHLLADEIEEKWEEYGLDLVERTKYDVLLSYPDEDNPNLIRLYQGDSLIHTSAENEEIPGEDNSGVIQPYNSYSPSGTFQGNLKYVNYCRREDFEQFIAMGYSVDGDIVICRYGVIFRGSKVDIASSYNATGVILFTDPKDFAVEGVDKVYPDTWWLPPTGVQRGTVFAATGDPLTPGYPSIPSAYRLQEEDAAEGLPSIPSHPIGYGDAWHFLNALDGDPVPAEWQGGLNFTYRFGPLNTNMSVEMTVNNKNTRADAVNVHGYIRGSVEPDRYVIIGGHRDAWAYGALDPNTGTAVTVEVARILSKFKNEGWRPRRTIVFCSWGAEEFGNIGSYEWVEQNVKKLADRAVAYLNLDTVVMGNFSLNMAALPILNDVTREAAKAVETPNQAGKSMFQEWLEAIPDPDDNTKPRVALLGSGSDHAPFFVFAGVPCINFNYIYNPYVWQISSYPVYHSAIETFKIFETFIDPDFKYMQAMARYSMEILLRLADSYVIPYNVTEYGDAIIAAQKEFEEINGDLLTTKGINLDDFRDAGEAFYDESRIFTDRANTMNRNNPVEVRAYNDAMMSVERAFMDPQGLPGRPLSRHVIFAPSSADTYAGSAFPGLSDALYQIEGHPQEEDRWDIFRRHLATVTYILESAAESLKEFHDI